MEKENKEIKEENFIENKPKKKKFKLKLIPLILIALIIIIFILGSIIVVCGKYFLVGMYMRIKDKAYNEGVSDTLSKYEIDANEKVENNVNKNKNQNSKKGNLDIESDLVLELYSKLFDATEICYDNEGSFYKKEQTNLNNLTDTEKLIATLQYLSKQEKEITNVEQIDSKIIEKLPYYNEGGTVNLENIKIYSQEEIKDATIKLFGKEVDLVEKNLNGCAEYWCYLDGNYYHYNYPGGGYGYYQHTYRQIQYAIQEENRIYIYDKMAYIKDMDYEIEYEGSYVDTYNGVYKSFDSEKFFALEGINFDYNYSNTDTEIIAMRENDLYLYKHTFEKDENGNYYWVSTEIEK